MVPDTHFESFCIDCTRWDEKPLGKSVVAVTDSCYPDMCSWVSLSFAIFDDYGQRRLIERMHEH